VRIQIAHMAKKKKCTFCATQHPFKEVEKFPTLFNLGRHFVKRKWNISFSWPKEMER